MKLTYIADRTDGVLKIRGRKQLDQELNTLAWPVIKITFEKHKAKRSHSQNAYYHAVIIPVLQEGMKQLGHVFSLQTVHDMMKAKFLKEDILLNEHGEYITRIKSTTELNKEQFGEYIDQINAWAAEYLNIEIPAPNTQTTLL